MVVGERPVGTPDLIPVVSNDKPAIRINLNCGKIESFPLPCSSSSILILAKAAICKEAFKASYGPISHEATTISTIPIPHGETLNNLRATIEAAAFSVIKTDYLTDELKDKDRHFDHSNEAGMLREMRINLQKARDVLSKSIVVFHPAV